MAGPRGEHSARAVPPLPSPLPPPSPPPQVHAWPLVGCELWQCVDVYAAATDNFTVL
jgi:hypothetical protein